MTQFDRTVAATLLTIAGVGMASAHWLGIIFGAALLAQLGRSVREGVLLGVGFGILIALAFVGQVVINGHFDRLLAMDILALLPIVIAVGGGLIGGLTRGVR